MSKERKTIFVSINNRNVARNAALLPDSIVDLLAAQSGVKVVLLLKKGGLDYVREKFEKLACPNLIIEEYAENIGKDFFQKLIYFFFSYLIFTPTTKLVSSYGVRSDRPRPLVSYWNFPIKWFLANVLGKWRYFKNELSENLYLKIFYKRPYRYLFDKYNPDLIFATSALTWPCDLEFLAEARRRGISTAGMPANWDHLSKYFIPLRPDKLLVWSGPVKEEALKYQGYNSEDVKISGAAHMDYFLKENSSAPRKEFLESLNFPKNAFVITYFSQGPYSLDGPDYVDMILKWIEAGKLKKNIYIVVRPHPQGLWETEKYLPFSKNPRVHIDKINGWSSLKNVRHYIGLLKHSDIILTTYSTIAAEASIFDRPTIIASFDGYKKRPMYQSVKRHGDFTHFQYILPLGAIRVANSEQDFFEALRDYSLNPKRDSDARRKLREYVFGYLDGKNGARARDEILNLI